MATIQARDATIRPTDSCARCWLRQYTLELEQQGVFIPLCDECYAVRSRCISCARWLQQGELIRLCDECYWGRPIETEEQEVRDQEVRLQ